MKVGLVDDRKIDLDKMHVIISSIPEVEIIFSTTSAEEAYDQIKKETIDVLIADIEMPNLSGYELADIIHSHALNIAVIFVTATSGYAVHAFELNVHDYIMKPYLKERLIYFTEPSYLFLIPFALFIVIEVLRHLLINQFDVLKQQNKQFEEIRDHYNETFRIVRSERHDFLKHISALHFMLEKDQFIEVKKYLDGLVEKYEETNLSIKGEKGVVAGILNQAYRKATSLGISVYYDLDVPISSLPMKDHDLVSLIGNVLSNSIEASEEWQNKTSKQALLSLEFYKRSGLYVLICKNDSLPIPTTILDQLFKTYGHSTKKGTHEGLGTKIISDLVDQYGGFLDFTYKQEQFTIKIKIPAITN